jgi:hypothetical protein
MKKLICMSLAVLLLMMSAVSGQAERHGGGRGWGPGWGPVVGLGLGIGLWELSHPYRPGYYYYPQPVIIQQAPSDIYIQEAPQLAPVPTREPVYWYYCPDPQGYYPYVNQCPKGWMKVVPTPPGQ